MTASNILRHTRRWGPFAFDAGIVEKAIDRAIGVECGFDIGLNLGPIWSHRGNKARRAALLPDDTGGRFASCRVAVDDHDLGRARGKASAGGAAMPFPAPVISAPCR